MTDSPGASSEVKETIVKVLSQNAVILKERIKSKSPPDICFDESAILDFNIVYSRCPSTD